MLKGSAPQVAERLSQQGQRFDFAFCDPPYNKGLVQQIITILGRTPFLKSGGYLVVERSAHDELDILPEGCELVRTQRYGETIIDFILWNIPEK